MRSLRKIIFINSAHIRYAEVKLDGNVHFIGTQGVGKSTLLRAIMFFYNADKTRLGIPKEMKTFDEFYLPKADSYIVYEVEHELGPFSILVFRSTGRACYRFIDAPFQKEWLINERGEVTTEYKVISSRLGKIFMSKLVDRYEQFRDIIYGNSKELGKEFSRFQLMETRNYQNIYRSIQNVFLNSRLDADFIKDIIIRSMNEEEVSINLGYFRGQVSDFEQEYNDISKWYKTNAKGESAVRKQANAVIQSYHDLLYLKKQITNLCGELNYAIRTTNEKKPLMEKKISSLTEERVRQQKLLEEVQSKYEAEKTNINKSLGVVDENLKKCKEKKDYYAANNIDEIIQRSSKRSELSISLESLQQRLRDLTSQYDDITTKFKRLIDGENNTLEVFLQTKEKEKNSLKENSLSEKERILIEFNKKKDDIDQFFSGKLASIQEAVTTLKSEYQECDKELYSLQFDSPYKVEIDELQRHIQSLNEKSAVLRGEIKSNKAEIGKIQAEYEREETATKASFAQKINEKESFINNFNLRIDELDKILSKTKGTLYEWLNNNVQGWEKNIGKIISEEHVLYKTGLKPEKVPAEGSTLYGIKLDLTDLPMSVRKPDEIKTIKDELEMQVSQHKEELQNIYQEQENAINNINSKYTPKVKQLRELNSMNEAELSTIPSQIKTNDVKIGDLQRKTEKEKENKRSILNDRQRELAHRISEKENEFKKTQNQKEARQKETQKTCTTSMTDIDNSLKYEFERIDAEIKNQKNITESNIVKLRKQELDELKGKGADTFAVNECNTKIGSVKAELHYIASQEKLLTKYYIDKEEYLNKEDDFKGDKKVLSDNLNLLKEKYRQKEEAYNQKIASVNKEISESKSELTRIEDGLQMAETFICDSTLCPPMLRETSEVSTLKTPSEAVNELTGIIVSKHDKQNSFKQSINIFKSNFSAKNTFNFKTSLTLDEDYLDFASNLDEFVQNNMIESYRNRTSERYTDILSRVSAEIGDLARHESAVESIINDINSDFKDRNFVTAIKLIALRSKQTSDKMVLLMKRIKEFHDDNQFAMGEVNLFTTSNREDVNTKAVDYILEFMKNLNENPERQLLTLSDMFQLEFRIKENDNDTDWTSKLSHVGSEGTDTLVKAMVNIMLINVFKDKVSKKFGNFKIHCMMDEIGKLHPQNVKGILEFANSRNILLINSSPTTYNVSDYKYTYLLDKDNKSNTVVHSLISKI